MTPLLLSEILIVVGKIEYEYIKKVLKMEPIPEKEVKDQFNYHNQKPLIDFQE